MDEVSKARVVFRRALTIEQQNLESEMKKCEHEIRTTLDEWRVRKTEIKALEEAVELKEVIKTAKIAISGRRAAAELMKYGCSANDQACIEAARKLLEECKKIDGELSDYFNANEKIYTMFQAMADGEEGKKGIKIGKAASDKLTSERIL